jgi:hypothetical protein
VALTIETLRTTAHRERRTNSAGFSLSVPVGPDGLEWAGVWYLWIWIDEAGLHAEICNTLPLRLRGDGSSSYVRDVHCYAITADGTVVDENGDPISQTTPTPSGSITLTITDNAAATLISVDKVGDDIEADDGSDVYYADEVLGSNSTGNGTSGNPWRTLSKIVEERSANDQVWQVATEDYEWNGFFGPDDLTNWEFSAAPSATVNLLATAGFGQYGFNGTANDLRLVGYNFAPLSGTSVGGTCSTFADSEVSFHFTMFDVSSTGTESGIAWTNDSSMSGVYVHGCDLACSEFMLFAGGRCESINLVDSTLHQDSGIASASQSMFRIYAMRRSAFHRCTIIKENGNPATIRLNAIDESAHPGAADWRIDGMHGNYHNSFLDLVIQISDAIDDAHDVFVFANDSSYTGDFQSAFLEFNNIDVWHDRAGRGIRTTSAHSHCRDWRVTNSRWGRDPGTSTNDRGGWWNAFWVDAFGGTENRTRLRVIHNDFILLKYRSSSWSSLFSNSAAKIDQAYAEVSRNLFIYNVIAQGGLAEFGPTLPNTSLIGLGENCFVKTDLHSGTNAQSWIVRHSGGSADRTLAQWITDGIDGNATGHTIAHATVASTHYDFSLHRTRAGAAWEGAATRSDFCRYDCRGHVRGTTTTPGRFDPNATPETIGVPSSGGEITPETAGPHTEAGAPTLTGAIAPATAGPHTDAGAPTALLAIAPSTAGAHTDAGTPTLTGQISPATAGPHTEAGAPTLVGAGVISPSTAGPHTDAGAPTLTGQISPSTAGSHVDVGAPTLTGQISPATAGPHTEAGTVFLSGPNTVFPSTAGPHTEAGAPTVRLAIAPATAGPHTDAGAPVIAIVMPLRRTTADRIRRVRANR